MAMPLGVYSRLDDCGRPDAIGARPAAAGTGAEGGRRRRCHRVPDAGGRAPGAAVTGTLHPSLAPRSPRSPEGASVPARPPVPPTPSPRPSSESASDVVRWAAFSCLLVPVVLVVYGTSVGGAAAAALGLAAVTAACRVLLRHSERAATRARAEEAAPARGRRGRPASGARRGGRHGGGCAPEY